MEQTQFLHRVPSEKQKWPLCCVDDFSASFWDQSADHRPSAADPHPPGPGYSGRSISARRCGHKQQIMVISCRLEGRILQIKVLHCFINSAQSETYSVLSSALLFPRLCAHWCPAAAGLLSVTLCNCNYFGDKYDTLPSVWKLGVQTMLSVHKAKSNPELQSVWWMTQTPSILKKEGCWKELVLPKQQFESCKDQILHFMMEFQKR